jgi:hypothetical protein
VNPEFQRNLWLEAGPRRLAWAGVVLAAIYGSCLLLARDNALTVLGAVGAVVFVAAAVIWGSRSAGGAIAEEVRQRTWDFQRLSALTPWEMTWGKLFGSTVLAWAAGATGLLLAFVAATVNGQPDLALQYVVGGVGMALLLQAGALAGALVNVRRARAEGRVPNFRFTVLGFVGFLLVVSAARRVFPTRGMGGIFGSGGDANWWGLVIPSTWFIAISLAVFGAWALVAAWRLMRLELQMENGPWVWPAFVLFSGVWLAGLADAGATMRFAVAGTVFAVCAYIGAFADPADRVRLRQFGAAVRRGDPAAMRAALPLVVAPVILAILAAIGVAVSPLLGEGDEPEALLALAAVAFLLRDLAIVAYFRFGPRPGRGDFGAALGLALAYFVGGTVGVSLGQGGGALFFPSPQFPAISVFAGAVQAALIGYLAWSRIRAPERSEVA